MALNWHGYPVILIAKRLVIHLIWLIRQTSPIHPGILYRNTRWLIPYACIQWNTLKDNRNVFVSMSGPYAWKRSKCWGVRLLCVLSSKPSIEVQTEYFPFRFIAPLGPWAKGMTAPAGNLWSNIVYAHLNSRYLKKGQSHRAHITSPHNL